MSATNPATSIPVELAPLYTALRSLYHPPDSAERENVITNAIDHAAVHLTALEHVFSTAMEQDCRFGPADSNDQIDYVGALRHHVEGLRDLMVSLNQYRGRSLR